MMAQWARVLQVINVHVKSQDSMCASKPLIRSRDRCFVQSPLARQSSQMVCFQFSERPCLKEVWQRAMEEDTCSDLGKHTMVFTCSVLIPDCTTQIHMQTHHKQKEVDTQTDTPQTKGNILRVSVTVDNFTKEFIQYG